MPAVFRRTGTVIAALLCSHLLLAQEVPSVLISPGVATLTVGESRNFRATDKNGHRLHGVQWACSEPGVLDLNSEDEVEVTAKHPGHCTLTAHADQGFGDAQVEVMDGTAMKPGTILWSQPARPGCESIQLIQAVPTANGPDLYETSACPDGSYVTALTSDGMLLWRRRLGADKNVPSAIHTKGSFITATVNSAPVVPLNTHAASICDAVSVGMKQEVVKDLIKEHALPAATEFTETPWSVDEDGAASDSCSSRRFRS